MQRQFSTPRIGKLPRPSTDITLKKADHSRSFVTPEVGEIRFTQTDDAFYILFFTKPSETFIVDASLPILAGDKITIIGAGNGTEVAWSALDEGIVLTVPSVLADAGQYCWVLKIGYAS